jgi:hypothetical protein
VNVDSRGHAQREADMMTAQIKLDEAKYDDDFVAWTEYQAELLRAGRFAELDIPNLIEEIESLGRSDARSLKSSYRLILMHLLKWDYQPERKSGSWRSTIIRERDNAADLIKDSPSLKRKQDGLFREAYDVARREAAAETGLPESVFPTESPWSLEQAMNPKFFP